MPAEKQMSKTVEFGLDTFGDVTVGPDGQRLPQAQVIRNVLDEAILADETGVDFIGVGEHHRDDFAVSAPEVVLAGIATRTSRIKLGSAVTVLSSDDPIRVFERFSTVDALSNGRAEVIIGRGSFTESFPLFGYALNDYEVLFNEKLDLFAELLKNGPVNWQGKLRPPLKDQTVYPPIENGRLKAWIGVGGSPESVVRSVTYQMPMTLAIIGGEPARFAPFFKLYRDSAAQAGHDTAKLPTSINVHGYVGETLDEANEAFYLAQKDVMDRIGRERGWGPSSRAQYDAAVSPRGNLFLGDPQMVIDKILANHEIFGFDRFVLQMAIGVIPHKKMLKAIELYGTKVAPAVRKAVS